MKWLMLNGRMLFTPMLEEDGKGGGGGDDKPKGDPKNDDKNDKKDDNERKDDKDDKSFSQDQLNGLLAKEKYELMRSLGFEKLEDLRAYLEDKKKEDDSKKTEIQRIKDEADAKDKKISEAEQRAAKIELKLKLFEAGANKDFLDDLLVLIESKVKTPEEIGSVLKDIKTKYPNMFGDSSGSSTGTGNPYRPARTGGKKGESNAERIAKAKQSRNASTKPKESEE